MPTGTEIYATRDIDRLGRMAADHGPAIGLYAAAILDTPLPWTKMRQVYRLLGLVKKWGPERVELACHRALEAEAHRREPGLAHARAGPRGRRSRRRSPTGRHPGTLRPRSLRVRQRHRGRTMSAPTPSVSPELKVLMRRLKLGQLLATLPERLALARSHNLGHVEFLEQLFSDEVSRRDAASAGVRARAAKLDPHMVLEAWDEGAKVTYDRAVWSELVSMRFVDQARNAFILGPVGVGKTFMATALGHIACRRRISVHFERHDRLHKTTQGGASRRQLRPRDAQAHRRRPARDRRLRPPAARHARDGRHLRALRGAPPRQGHRADLEP